MIPDTLIRLHSRVKQSTTILYPQPQQFSNNWSVCLWILVTAVSRLTAESTINCFYSFCMCSTKLESILDVYFYQKLLQQYFFLSSYTWCGEQNDISGRCLYCQHQYNSDCQLLCQDYCFSQQFLNWSTSLPAF